MSLDTMGDFIWKPLVFRLVTSVPGIQPLCGRLPAASRPGLQMLLSRKCSHRARRRCGLSCPSGARDPVYNCAPGPSPGANISPRNRGGVANAEG